MSEGPDEQDTFKILLATDTHLGYLEKDPIRGNDSFVTFEEILRHAADNSVDFILLGGDLFHDSKPSPTTYNRCMILLRKYCLGDNPVPIELLSDPSESLDSQSVNYEDPNLNVGIPVFTIHGNHDDPTGPTMQCALDMLSTAGYVNHFGKWTDMSKVELKPMLLRKGKSLLALYGMGHMRDSRFARLLRDDKVKFFRPQENRENWFSLLVLHQNRASRGFNNYVQEQVLPDFLDLVVWGHEHDCRIEPEFNPINKVYITQPGSSVATSLAEGEALPKHIAVLRVYQRKFLLEPIRLKTVRPFIFHTLCLAETDITPDTEKCDEAVEKLADERMKEMLREAEQLKSGGREQPSLPLLRLRIEYSSELQMFNTIRFGQKYETLVANPSDVILMRKKSDAIVKRENPVDNGTLQEAIDKTEKEKVESSIYKVMEEYFLVQNDRDNSRCMQVLSSMGLIEASMRFAERNDKDSIDCIVRHQVQRTLEYLLDEDMPDYENDVTDYLERYRLLREERAEEESKELKAQLDVLLRIRSQRSSSTRGRGRGRGAKTSASTSLAAADDCTTDLFDESNMDANSDSDFETDAPDESALLAPPKTGRGSRGGPGSRGGRGSRGRRGAAAKPATTAGQSFAELFNASRRKK